MSATKIAPFYNLTITGAGFNADEDIHVRFFDELGYSVSVPVGDVTGTSLTVGVPAYINPDTEMFGAGTVGVQVVQSSGTDNITTNTIEGLQITDLPAADGTPGTATLEYLDEIIQLLQDSEYHLECLEEISDGYVTDPILSECLNNLEADFIDIKAQVQSLVTGSNSSIEIGNITLETGETLSMNLDMAAVATIDRLVTSYNQRLSDALNNNIAIAPLKPKVDFASRKPIKAGDFEFQADESASEERWRVQDQFIKDVQHKIETVEGYVAPLSAMVTLHNKQPDRHHHITLMTKDEVAAKLYSWWYGNSAIAIVQDYDAASAATGSEALQQEDGFFARAFKNISNYLATGEKPPEVKNKSFLDIIISAFKTNSASRLVSEMPFANAARVGAMATNQLPQDSNLGALFQDEKPAVPESLAGKWTGTGWSYDCCEDDGTRLSKITWDVYVFITSQNGTNVVGKITLVKVKQEIIDPIYAKPVSGFSGLHLMDGKTAEQFFYFHTPSWAWSWEISADRYSMDGFFEGPGPGQWCTGKTFHLTKYR